jgi:hypothetical protein
MKKQLVIFLTLMGFSARAQNTNLDSLLTQTQWNSLFPKRAGTFGVHPQGYTADFYSYSNLKQAAKELADYKVTIRKKIGVWGELTTITRISTNTTYNYSDVDAWWYTNSTAETVIQVNFKDFVNRISATNNKRELAAFLANISKETTGGWQTPVGGGTSGDYAQWGLYFVHEVGYSSATSAGTYSQAHAEYPPNASKGYYGRGPIQLSWNYNYGQFSKFIFNDKNVLINNPDTIQKDGVLAFKSAIWFWMMPQCPKPSCHQVLHNLWLPATGEYSANKMYNNGFAHTNNIINGGLECRTSSSAAFTAKVVLRSDLYKYYMGIMGFDSAQIASENQGSKTTLCYESATNAMQDYVNCAVVACATTFSSRTKAICSPRSYFYNGKNRDTSGSYKDTFVNAKGCDSIETLTLVVFPQKTTNISQSICQGDSFLFNNVYLKASGTYRDTILSSQGCDSILTLNLIVNSTSNISLTQTICQGDSFYFNNTYLKSAGVYINKLTNTKGCDSIISLTLMINSFKMSSITKSICTGDSIFFGSKYYKQQGAYQAKSKAQNGCDSIVNLNLILLSSPSINIVQSSNQLVATSGFPKYQWFLNSVKLDSSRNTLFIATSGNYKVEVEDINGCKNSSSKAVSILPVKINTLTSREIVLYPSPSLGVVYISGLEAPVLIQVYDVLGVKHLETIVENQFDLSHLSNGLYWVSIAKRKYKISIEK